MILSQAFIHIAGTYFLPNKQLHQPRASILLRKIDEVFLAKLQKDMEMEPERDYGIRSPLPGACNSHTKPMLQRFHRLVYF